MKKKIKKLTRPQTSTGNLAFSQTPNSNALEFFLNNANNYASLQNLENKS